MCLFWQDPPCVGGRFPCLTCWIGKLDLFTSRDPVSTHTSIWPFSHTEVQAGGNKPFFPLWGIQHEHSAHARSGPVKQNSSTGSAVCSSNTTTPPLPESRLLVNNIIQKGVEDRPKLPGFSSTSSSLVARNVKRFPRKFLLLQEDMEGNHENFDTLQAVGVSMKKRGGKVLIGLLLAKCMNSIVEHGAE